MPLEYVVTAIDVDSLKGFKLDFGQLAFAAQHETYCVSGW